MSFTARSNVDRVVLSLDRFGRDFDRRCAPMALRQFYEGWKAKRVRGWNKMRVTKGGVYFGKKWAPLQSRYTRKTDGKTVYAWEETERIAPAWRPPGKKRPKVVKGKVLARKRSSARTGTRSNPVYPTAKSQRISKRSVLLASGSAQLRNQFLAERPRIKKKFRGTVLLIGEHHPEWAVDLHKKRPFAFWQQKEDGRELKKAASTCADEAMRRWNGSRR